MKPAVAFLACALAAVPSAPAFAGARQEATVLMSQDPGGLRSQQELGYADAVVTGDTIYLSGIVVGQRAGETSFEPGYERVYARIGTILARAGASWDDVVDISSFHTDVAAQIGAMAAVHKRYVKTPFPAWTAIGVAKLLGNGITEIKIVAKRPAAAAARE